VTLTPLSRSKGQLVADVLNSQHTGTGAILRINTKILSTCRPGRGHSVTVTASRTAC